MAVILTEHFEAGIVGRALEKTHWKFLFSGNLGSSKNMDEVPHRLWWAREARLSIPGKMTFSRL